MTRLPATVQEFSFEAILEKAKSLGELGVCLWRMFACNSQSSEDGLWLGTDSAACRWWKKFNRDFRVPRVSRALFPMGSRWKGKLDAFPVELNLNELIDDPCVVCEFSEVCWCELVTLFLNHLYNGSVGFGSNCMSKAQEEFTNSIAGSVHRWLLEDCKLDWKKDDVVKDLGKKMINYTGEEVCKAEPLSVFRVAPALPPEGHGGSIDCASRLSGKNRWYLENPHSCVSPDTGQILPKLRARYT